MFQSQNKGCITVNDDYTTAIEDSKADLSELPTELDDQVFNLHEEVHVKPETRSDDESDTVQDFGVIKKEPAEGCPSERVDKETCHYVTKIITIIQNSDKRGLKKCAFCRFQFRFHALLDQHMSTETCSKCGFRGLCVSTSKHNCSEMLETLNETRRRHNYALSYSSDSPQCHLCSFNHTDPEVMNNHYKDSIHPQFQCFHCGVKVPTREILLQHSCFAAYNGAVTDTLEGGTIIKCRRRCARRNRYRVIDHVKNIWGEELQNQLLDTSDIVTTLNMAPSTKRMMHRMETGGVEQLFELPARPIRTRALFKAYQRHLVTPVAVHA